MATKGKTVADWLLIKTDPKKLVEDCYLVSKRANEQNRDDWRKVRNAYHGYIADSARKYGRANFHFHKIFPQIELQSARFILNYFRHDPFINVTPTNSDSVEAAQRHERILQHYLELAPSFYLEKLRLVKYTNLYGTAFEMPTWRRQVQKIKRQVPIVIHGLQVGVEEVESEEVVYDGLWFKTFSPFDVFPWPFAYDMTSLPKVVIVEFAHVNDILSRAKQGIFDTDKVNRIPLNSHLQNEWELVKQQSDRGHPIMQQDEELVCLQHLFSPDRCITLANGYEVIRDEKNQFWHQQIPMVRGVKTLDPDSFWPISSAKAMLPSQKLLNLFVNMMTDHAISTLWPVWKYVWNGADPNQLLSLPNHRIGVKSMDSVDVVRMPEMKMDLAALKTMIEANLEEQTGYHGTQKGYSPTQHTATSDVIFQTEGNLRIEYDVKTFEEATLVPEAELVSKTVQQFMPAEMDVRLNGPGGTQFMRVTPEDIRGQFNFRCSGSSEAMNRAVVQQQLIELFNITKDASQYVQMPTGQIVPVPLLDTYWAIKELYEGYGRMNTDKLLYRPEVFGVPITNNLLNNYGLPSIPGLDQLQPNPRTGALRAQGAVNLQNMPKSVNPGDIINRANRPTPTPVGVM